MTPIVISDEREDLGEIVVAAGTYGATGKVEIICDAYNDPTTVFGIVLTAEQARVMAAQLIQTADSL